MVPKIIFPSSDEFFFSKFRPDRVKSPQLILFTFSRPTRYKCNRVQHTYECRLIIARVILHNRTAITRTKHPAFLSNWLSSAAAAKHFKRQQQQWSGCHRQWRPLQMVSKQRSPSRAFDSVVGIFHNFVIFLLPIQFTVNLLLPEWNEILSGVWWRCSSSNPI